MDVRESGRPVAGALERRWSLRSRWAAVGAALAVTAGAGGLGLVSATGSPPSSMVSITPVRVLDTRVDLGLPGPFVSPAGRVLPLTGSVATPSGSQVVVPEGMTAVSLNVTVVQPTAAGFVSVRPAGTPGAPETSNLNFDAGDIVPNAVIVALPDSASLAGAIEITYDAFGEIGPTAHVLVDVMGYFEAGAAGLQGPPGPPGAQGASGPRGASAWDTIPSGVTVTGHVVWQLHAAADTHHAFSVALPARAPVALTSDTVNFSTSSGGLPDVADGDPQCTGSPSEPAAPTGKVCLYLHDKGNATSLRGTSTSVLADQTFAVTFNPLSPGSTWLEVSWAYTAP